MRIVVQRVRNAEVAVPDQGYKAQIGHGLLVLAAFIDEDTAEDLEWTARKLVAMRIFDDSEGVMNLSVKDVGGEIMVVSQFTLYASTVKGNRPSYIKAAKPDIAVPLYEKFVVLENMPEAFQGFLDLSEYSSDMLIEDLHLIVNVLREGGQSIIIKS